jgi:hypothetical protein
VSFSCSAASSDFKKHIAIHSLIVQLLWSIGMPSALFSEGELLRETKTSLECTSVLSIDDSTSILVPKESTTCSLIHCVIYLLNHALCHMPYQLGKVYKLPPYYPSFPPHLHPLCDFHL